MATKLFTGYERTERIRLPDSKITVDVKSPMGASTMATIIRAQKTGDYENVGNALALHDVVQTTNSNKEVVIGTEEVTVLTDKAGKEHRVTDPKTLEVLLGQGLVFNRIEQREIMG